MAAYTRRHFANLLQAGAIAVAGFRPAGLQAGINSGDAGVRFSRAHFERLIGSPFHVSSDAGGRFSLTLIAVEDMSRRPRAISPARTVDCALLRFSSGDSALAEGIHRLAHERNGDYDLYLSPGKPGRYLAYLCC